MYKHKDTLANNHMKNYEENKKWTCIKQQGMTCVKGSSSGRGISDIEKRKTYFNHLMKSIHTYTYIKCPKMSFRRKSVQNEKLYIYIYIYIYIYKPGALVKK